MVGKDTGMKIVFAAALAAFIIFGTFAILSDAHDVSGETVDAQFVLPACDATGDGYEWIYSEHELTLSWMTVTLEKHDTLFSFPDDKDVTIKVYDTNYISVHDDSRDIDVIKHTGKLWFIGQGYLSISGQGANIRGIVANGVNILGGSITIELKSTSCVCGIDAVDITNYSEILLNINGGMDSKCISCSTLSNSGILTAICSGLLTYGIKTTGNIMVQDGGSLISRGYLSGIYTDGKLISTKGAITASGLVAIYAEGTITMDNCRIILNVNEKFKSGETTSLTQNDTEYGIFLSNSTTSQVVVTPKDINMRIGDQTTLEVSYRSDVIGYFGITWVSTNEKVVTVDENGNIKAVGIGVASVKAVSNIDEEQTGVCLTIVNSGHDSNAFPLFGVIIIAIVGVLAITAAVIFLLKRFG